MFEKTKQAPEHSGQFLLKEQEAWWVPQTLQVSIGSDLQLHNLML